tara:strand:- start:1 stop:231 length:231 start_codon:yes stop_codon:yes gene_type:complete
MNRTELNQFVNDIFAYIQFVNENYSEDYDKELKIKGTLIHDLSGVLSGDEHFSPRVDGYDNLQYNVKEIEKYNKTK